MNADGRRWELNEITEKIIGCAFTVGKGLGCGFLEKVYENALAYELRQIGLLVEQQYDIEVQYKGIVVGKFLADLLVERRVLVELKAVRVLDENHFAQCLNYLKATGLNVCLLINFGNPKVEFKRIVRNL
ncbi:GxxExxY protein [Mastigocladopsis repens]|uniref:GxxExxY protein n=1 Tax=Mastigocladopsis repens TaxID=221287 RepID=UPI0002DA5556|nr:GxxExxY protein [Mastigocladopsis repens]